MTITQSDTTPILFYMSLASDATGRTPATGLAPAVTLSKAGAAFAAAAGSVAEISSGWYKLTPTAADTGTLGDLAVRATAATADDWNDLRRVIAPVATQALLTTVDGRLDTEIPAILAKTNLIPAAPAAVSDVPTAAAVAAATLAAAVAAPIAADIQAVNAVPIIGNGSSVPWGP